MARPVQASLAGLIDEYGWSDGSVLENLLNIKAVMEEWNINSIPPIGQRGLDDVRVFASGRTDSAVELMLAEIAEGENASVEWKETLLLDVRKLASSGLPPEHCFSDKVLNSSLKTIAAFLNTSGGTLLIGVDDQGKITGVERDFPLVAKAKKFDFDEWELFLRSLIEKHFFRGRAITSSIQIQRCHCEGRTVARIVVGARKELCFMKGESGEECLYVRTGNRTLVVPFQDIEGYFDIIRRA